MGISINKFAKEMAVIIPKVHRGFIRQQSRVLTGEISFAQMAILHLLKEHKICKMKDIAKMFSITTSAATGIVDRLVRSGLLKRGADPHDRRVINVKATAKGKKIINSFLRAREKAMVNIFRNFSAGEREVYLNTVKKICAILTRKKE